MSWLTFVWAGADGMKQETLASGRYILDRVIGTGGMADVYRARDTRLGRDVAVKMFRRGSADGVARGSGEARMLAALHHPGLVRVLDMDAECVSVEPAYLVMEYVKGPDLSAMLRGGPLSLERATTAGRDIARTLEYIHGRGIVHRDIKPSNVLMRQGETRNGLFDFLLTDFGIARFFESSRVTATGSLIGTATYFSPEQARGDRVGTPTDIYALGLVLIECLTGQPAFPGTGLESALARLSRPPTIPESFGPGWQSLLTDMTRDDPQSRPTATEVVRRLETLDPELTAEVTGHVSDEADEVAERPLAADAAVERVADPAQGVSGLAVPDRDVTEPGGDMHTAPAEAPRRSKGGRRALGLAAVVVVLLMAIAAVAMMFFLGQDPAASPSPLPTVPGTTGALLDNLYESVQP
ncbi:protein kinase domain-containing protein [Arthrobacter sp. JZ12]|uniref:protein kinase domain-containing protein n=1 Tax=Arthrobacter sp. JZ12 TaxID=2654190 RepID=UPI002B49DF44|nr:protein kinase [Arthrobacter sp. JZ12]